MASLIIPAFIAGLLTFLAPCTFPLVPAYLAFISGNRHRSILSALLYVLGFSSVFITLGVAFALGGVALVQYRFLLSQVGGGMIIFFGIVLLGASRLPGLRWLNFEYKWQMPTWLQPGNPASAFALGIIFAAGWTPCIGPILGSVLLLAAHTTTVWQGAALLAVFSFGLALPFLGLALLVDSAKVIVKKLKPIIPVISVLSGVVLILFGGLLLTNRLELWNQYIYSAFDFMQYDSLLNYL